MSYPKDKNGRLVINGDWLWHPRWGVHEARNPGRRGSFLDPMWAFHPYSVIFEEDLSVGWVLVPDEHQPWYSTEPLIELADAFKLFAAQLVDARTVVEAAGLLLRSEA